MSETANGVSLDVQGVGAVVTVVLLDSIEFAQLHMNELEESVTVDSAPESKSEEPDESSPSTRSITMTRRQLWQDLSPHLHAAREKDLIEMWEPLPTPDETPVAELQRVLYMYTIRVPYTSIHEMEGVLRGPDMDRICEDIAEMPKPSEGEDL